MPQPESWQEVESEVYRPATGMTSGIGMLFLMIGLVGLATVWTKLPAGLPGLIGSAASGFFALMGGGVVAFSLRSTYRPPRVRHAAPDVLPQVPNEPVPLEGSIVSGQLSNELVETSDGWQFRPSPRIWRIEKEFFFGFAIPFALVFAGLAGYGFHEQRVGSWPVSILAGVAVTVMCGGTAFLVIFLMMRSSFHKLSCLTIPRQGDLQLEIPPPFDLKTVQREGINVMLGVHPLKHVTIPREQLLAVQLCPWKITLTSSRAQTTTWAVQGLLVLAGSEGVPYNRLPILLTSNVSRAARLMRDLADVLQVPYLFGADAAGWRLEEHRALKRPPLQAGGIM